MIKWTCHLIVVGCRIWDLRRSRWALAISNCLLSHFCRCLRPKLSQSALPLCSLFVAQSVATLILLPNIDPWSFAPAFYFYYHWEWSLEGLLVLSAFQRGAQMLSTFQYGTLMLSPVGFLVGSGAFCLLACCFSCWTSLLVVRAWLCWRWGAPVPTSLLLSLCFLSWHHGKC